MNAISEVNLLILSQRDVCIYYAQLSNILSGYISKSVN